MKRVIEINEKNGTAQVEFNGQIFYLKEEPTGIDLTGRQRPAILITLDLFVNNAVTYKNGMFYGSNQDPLFWVSY